MATAGETITTLARRIKTKYPDYADVNDTELVRRIVAKYPEYRETLAPEEAANIGGAPQVGTPEFQKGLRSAAREVTRQRGMQALGKYDPKPGLWEKINTGIVSPETITRAVTGRTREELGEMMQPGEGESPAAVAARTATLGALADIGEVTSPLTSPAGIAMMGLGVAGRAPTTLGRLARIGAAAPGAVFAGEGVSMAGMPRQEGESLADVTQRRLLGAGMAVGGAAPIREGVRTAARTVPPEAIRSQIAELRPKVEQAQAEVGRRTQANAEMRAEIDRLTSEYGATSEQAQALLERARAMNRRGQEPPQLPRESAVPRGTPETTSEKNEALSEVWKSRHKFVITADGRVIHGLDNHVSLAQQAGQSLDELVSGGGIRGQLVKQAKDVGALRADELVLELDLPAGNKAAIEQAIEVINLSPADRVLVTLRISDNSRTYIEGTPSVAISELREKQRKVRKGLPNYQAGGVVKKTGPAFLHRGEVVLPVTTLGRAARGMRI